jgi:hypothetical protein
MTQKNTLASKAAAAQSDCVKATPRKFSPDNTAPARNASAVFFGIPGLERSHLCPNS